MNQPLAYVHPQAKIARNVVIEPFTTIHNNVVIGSGTWIGSNVTIMEGARIGKNCRIFPGAVISAIPQDLKFEDEETTVEIGDNVTIRECVTINRGTKDRMKTTVGDNCLIMAYCHIAHDCFVGNDCIFSNNTTLAGHVKVGDNTILGGNVMIHQFCQIGANCMIGISSIIVKDVPDFLTCMGSPTVPKGMNFEGLKRRGVDKDDPTKVCAVMQAAPGTMDAFMSANAELIASSGHVLESTIDTIYIG
mgnify:CR=1 FL=1